VTLAMSEAREQLMRSNRSSVANQSIASSSAWTLDVVIWGKWTQGFDAPSSPACCTTPLNFVFHALCRPKNGERIVRRHLPEIRRKAFAPHFK
jgi:hypothetical protein